MAGRPKIRSGEIVNAPKRTPMPRFIDKFDESLVGKRVWYFDAKIGVTSIIVSEIYQCMNRNRRINYGLMYKYEKKRGSIGQKTLWCKDHYIFDSRGRCNTFLKAMIEKSEAERVMNKALGLE